MKHAKKKTMIIITIIITNIPVHAVKAFDTSFKIWLVFHTKERVEDS